MDVDKKIKELYKSENSVDGLSHDERMAIYNLIAKMNGYQIFGVLCQSYSESELKQAEKDLLSAMHKICG